jgi:site-specific recombinase XerD
MSGKLRLGKTKDSRTRKQSKDIVNANALVLQKQLLSEQKEFTDYLLIKGYSTSTVQGYIKDVFLFTTWAEKQNIPIEEASYTDVLGYIQYKRKQVVQRTISSYVNSIKHYYNYLSVIGKVLENPTTQIEIKGIKRKILYHTLNKQELESLYNNFELPKEDDLNKNQNWFKTSVLVSKRNKVIVGLLVYQGLNTSDISNLMLQDIKLREGKIYIAGTRRSNERELNLEAHQMLDLMEYTLQTRNELLKITNKASNHLFVSTGEGVGFANMMQKLLMKLNKLNSKLTSIQQLRTSVITQWLKLYNLRQVQYMAGHRYVSSTESYLINDVEDLQDDITKYHPTI